MSKLGLYIEEINNKTTINNQHEVLTSSQDGIVSQNDYFNKQVASDNNVGYKIIKRGEFTYRSMSDTGRFYVNQLQNKDIGIVSPAYPVFKIRNQSLKADYLSLFFKSNYFQKQISTESAGSTRLALRFNRLNNIEIKVPNEKEQEFIVHSIARINEALSLEKDAIKLLDETIKSRFNELFGDVESNTHGYQICKLSEISSYWNGLTYKPTDVVEDKTGTLVLRSSNIQNGELDFQDNVYVNCPIKDRHFVKENDILMCSRNGSAKLVGKVALIKGLNEPTSFGAFMMIIRSKYYQYLKSFFESAAFKHQLSTGTATINQITGNMLNEIKLPIPPMNVVDQFSSFVESVDKLKFNVQQRIEKYQELLNKKMDEYFN